MNVLIIGCGRTGAQLANSLFKQGHAVSVVDSNEASLGLLNPDFAGMITVGVPIDVSVLKKAGIEQCDVVVAITNDDNINAMVAQVAKEVLKVERVFARIQDPLRSQIFSNFGFDNISTTNLAASEFEARIMDVCAENEHRRNFDRSRFKFTALEIEGKHASLGHLQPKYEKEGQLIGVVHEDGSILMLKDAGGYRVKKGDRLLFLQKAE